MTSSGRNTPSSNSRMSSVEVDVCFPTPNKKEEGGIDYEGLEDYLLRERKELSEHKQKNFQRTMSGRRYSMYGDRLMVKDIVFLKIISDH